MDRTVGTFGTERGVLDVTRRLHQLLATLEAGPERDPWVNGNRDVSTVVAHPFHELVTHLRVIGVATGLPHLLLDFLCDLRC